MKNTRICICCLTRGYHRLFLYDALIRRNQYIKKTILDSVDADISMIIFHEGNISKKQQDYITRHSKVPSLEFVSVKEDFKPRAAAAFNTYCHPTDYSERFSYGYKCMCAFWMDGFVKYTENYDYILRIDEDCMITQFPLDDLIVRMEANEYSYVSALNFGRDSEDCTMGLMRFVQDYCRDNGLDAEKATIDNCPYSNVFLMKLRFYRTSRIYSTFTQAVRDSDSIFINRWGDHVLWKAILSMHPGDDCHFDDRIAYYHGSHSCVVRDGISYKGNVMAREMNLRGALLCLHALYIKARMSVHNVRSKRRLP